MRKLNIDDAFTFSEIVDQLGIEVDLNKWADDFKGKSPQYIGGQVGLLLLKKLSKAKPAVMQFLASYAELSVEELSKKPLSYLKDMFIEMAKDESFDSFFPQGKSKEKKSKI